MDFADLIRRAATTTSQVVSGVKPEQLDGPSPCSEWDVRELGNHMTGFLAYSAAAARKQTPLDSDGGPSDMTGGDWGATYRNLAADTAEAWAEAGSLEGETHFGQGPMPAQNAAGVTLMELVVHGWDLAAATGQTVEYDADVVAVTNQIVEGATSGGAPGGFFAPPVAVGADAGAMDQTVAKSGRNPTWGA
jgi:uncharacterized protein (TIGR03086 family)